MRLSKVLSPWHLAVLTLSLAACERGGSPAVAQKPKTDSPVVAVVGERTITASELQAKLDEQPPFVRARYASLEKKKEFLENLIRFELLAQEAWRRGLDQDQEVRETLEKVMVQKLLRTQSGEAEGGTLPESELRKYYDEHPEEFVKPERVRLSHIFLASPRADAKRNEAQASAAKLLAELKGQEVAGNSAAFEGNAKSRSDDETTKAVGGDLGYRSREELTQAWGPALADAAFGLKTIGDFGPVVATDKGLHVVKLAGRQVGLNLPFETAKPRIESRLLMERRAKSLETLVASLREKGSVQIKDAELEKVKVDGTSAAAGAPTP